jgi:hypothetical protein
MSTRVPKYRLRLTTLAFVFFLSTLMASPADLFAPEKTDPAAAGMDPVLLARIPAKLKTYVDQGTAKPGSPCTRTASSASPRRPSR